MSPRSGESRIWRSTALIAVLGVILVLFLGGGPFRVSAPPVAGKVQSRELDAASSGTPVATPVERENLREIEATAIVQPDVDPQDADPLDGDPLDGKPSDKDPDAPVDQTQLEIVRSGRPNDEPATVAVYDGDPTTTWVPAADAEETWLWLDVGAERRLRSVRWLGRGSGSIEVSLSSDRERWRDVERVDVRGGWQGIDVRDDARYVRLTLLADDDGVIPGIAEATVYGSDRGESVSSEQRADSSRDRKRDPRQRRNTESAVEQEAGESTRGWQWGRGQRRRQRPGSHLSGAG